MSETVGGKGAIFKEEVRFEAVVVRAASPFHGRLQYSQVSRGRADGAGINLAVVDRAHELRISLGLSQVQNQVLTVRRDSKREPISC